MPYEDLIQSVETSARERIQEIVERARNETDEIVKDARSREGLIKRKRLEDAQKAVDVERIRLISRIKEENHMKIYGIKDEIFNRAFQEARQKLESLVHSPAYEAVFRTLALEALAGIGTPQGVLHVVSRDEAIGRRLLGDSGRAFEVATDLEGSAGAIVSSPDGSVIVMNTFESRLTRAKELMRPEIFSILFGD